MLDVQVALPGQPGDELPASPARCRSRNGNAHPNIQPQDVFACARRRRRSWWSATTGSSPSSARCSAGPSWLTDERFATNAERVRNIDELSPMLARGAGGAGRASDWSPRSTRAGVPCGPINTVAEVFEDPQVRQRGMLRSTCRIRVAVDVPQVVEPDALHRRAARRTTARRRCSASTPTRSCASWGGPPTRGSLQRMSANLRRLRLDR